jgi:hypothetical protein
LFTVCIFKIKNQREVFLLKDPLLLTVLTEEDIEEDEEVEKSKFVAFAKKENPPLCESSIILLSGSEFFMRVCNFCASPSKNRILCLFTVDP